MLASSWVVSTKREAALGRREGCQPFQRRGWALAPRDSGPEAGMQYIEGAKPALSMYRENDPDSFM
jgi:hypothetical protein